VTHIALLMLGCNHQFAGMQTRESRSVNAFSA